MMNTYTALLVTYGRPQVPLTVIAKDYFPEMSERTVKTRAATQQLPFPVMRGESQKATFLVDLRDLAQWCDNCFCQAREDIESGAWAKEQQIAREKFARHKKISSRGGIDMISPATRYYIKITTPTATLYKIGVTKYPVAQRFSDDIAKISVIKLWQHDTGEDAWKHEQSILREHTGHQYAGDPVIRSGNTELFTHDVLGLDR